MTGDLSRITDHPVPPFFHRPGNASLLSPVLASIITGPPYIRGPTRPSKVRLSLNWSLTSYYIPQLGGGRLKPSRVVGMRRNPAQFPRIVNRKRFNPTTSEFVHAVGVNKVCGASPNSEFEFPSSLCGATLHSNKPYQYAL